MLFYLSFILFFQYLSSLSKGNYLRWVPPSAVEWKNTDIPQNVKVYWENRWAKASFLKGCNEENSLKVIPVYFWPGERVDLPCKMCEMAFLTNGRIKRWGYSERIDEFLLNPTQFVRVHEIWEDVQNTPNFTKNIHEIINPDDVIWYPHTFVPEGSKQSSLLSSVLKNDKNYTMKAKKPPRYWQNEGKLSILAVSEPSEFVNPKLKFKADVRSQGVYFCYDEISRKQTSIFFVLMAMIPPVRFTTNDPLDYNDHCGSMRGEDSKKIFPSHNWRFHFLPMGDFNPPPTCQLDENDFEGCKQKYSYLNSADWPKHFTDDCSIDKCRARLYSPENNIDMYIELRWDDWTSCEGDQPTKRRESHCYVVRGEGSINIESMNSEHKKLYSWIKNLETVFDRKPFDTDGIRLHRKTKISGCYNKNDEESKNYEKYDQVWRKVFLPTLGIPDSGPVIQLENPFESCIRYTRRSLKTNEEAKSEHMIGTFSTQVDYC
uniref:Uncharacterized protein n=1 Tax=Caenorhabditis tropicalis TaxID=1561998 RepID=A0A1I7TDY9_9PELO